jgi:hypothetical protein
VMVDRKGNANFRVDWTKHISGGGEAWSLLSKVGYTVVRSIEVKLRHRLLRASRHR